MGLFVVTDRPEVERRGTLVVDAVVPCRCMLIVLDPDDWRECEEVEGPRPYPWIGRADGEEFEGTRGCASMGRLAGEEDGDWNEGVGRIVEEMVLVC